MKLVSYEQGFTKRLCLQFSAHNILRFRPGWSDFQAYGDIYTYIVGFNDVAYV